MATYHVRKDGSDSNLGTADTAGGAWLTIGRAITQPLVAGDTVNVRSGVYYERLTMTVSGTSVARITWNGELDGSGNPLTTIDGSSTISDAWATTAELGLTGTGAYRNQSAGLTGGGALWEATNLQLINQINLTQMNGTASDSAFAPAMTGAEMLAQAASYVHPGSGTNTWNGIEAIWGYRSSAPAGAYIRYRNGTDPNGRNLRWSPGLTNSLSIPTTACIHFSGISYNTWNNFILQGCVVGAFFDGTSATASNNIVSGGIIRGCHFRTYFYGQANTNVVRNVTLRSRLIGYVAYPVTKSRGSVVGFDVDTNTAYHQYATDKFWWGQTTERDASMKVRDSGTHKPTDNELHGCEIFEGAQGANWGGDGGGDGTLFYNNIVHHHASQGVYVQGASGLSGPTDWSIYNNVFYLNNHAVRTNDLNHSMGTCYFANNVISDIDGYATHMPLYKSVSAANSNFASTIWFTHNTFHGGHTIFELSAINSGFGAPTWYFVNNAYAMQDNTRVLFTAVNDVGGVNGNFESTQSRIPAWAQSAHRGSFSTFGNPPGPAWYDSGNIILSASPWSTASRLMTFDSAEPPALSPLLQSAVRLDQPFTIRSVVYPALPTYLYPVDYFSGVAPNMGAWQDTGPVPPATLSATPTTVAQGATVTVSWTDVTTPLDWIGLYVAGAPNSAVLAWAYTSSGDVIPGGSTVANGSVGFVMNFPASVYDFRLFFNDTFTLLDTSDQVTVTQAGAGSLPGTSDIIIF